jgi:hypothetical protein
MSYQVIYLNDILEEKISIEVVEAQTMLEALSKIENELGVNAAQILAIMLVNE